MPEWLRLFKQPLTKGLSSIRKTPYVTPVSVVKSVPEITKSTLPKFSFEPLLLALPPVQKGYVAPQIKPASDEAIRTATRLNVGLPSNTIVPDYMTFDELGTLLNTQMKSPASYDVRSTLNQGIQPGFPGYIDNFDDLLENAANRYSALRERIPYTSFDEAVNDSRMLGRYGYYGSSEAALKNLAEDYVTRGLGLPPRFNWLQEETTRNLFNSGRIPKEHPFVKGYMSDFNLHLPKMPEDFMEVFAGLTGTQEPHESSEVAARTLWPLVTKKVVPGSKKDKQLQLTYGQQFREIVDLDKFRNLLSKIENIESLPDREQTWLRNTVGKAYTPPKLGSLENIDPWREEMINSMSGAAKGLYGVDLSPEEMLKLYDVRSPEYPQLAERVRKGMEILPGDLKHFNWFQVRDAKESIFPGVDWSLPALKKITPEQTGSFIETAENNWKALKEKEARTLVGLQESALYRAMPPKTAITEQHTSADSYRLGVKKAGKSSNYGTEPGQIQIMAIPDRGDFLRKNGNNYQLNRLRYDENGKLVSDLGIPEIEKFTFKRSDMEKLLNEIKHLDPTQLRTFIQENPQSSVLIDNAISAVKALHRRDLSNVRPAFELINRKHRKLGLPEIAGPGENDFPKLTSEEGFYDDSNIINVIDLLSSLNRDAKYGGFAERLSKRTPYITLQNKLGGKIST